MEQVTAEFRSDEGSSLVFGVKWKVCDWSPSCWRGMHNSLAFALSFHACFSPDAALALLALAEL